MRKRSIKGFLRRGAGLIVALSVVALLAALPADGQQGPAPAQPVAKDRDVEEAGRPDLRPERPTSTTTSTTEPPSQVGITPAAVTDSGSTSTSPIVDALAASGIPEVAMRAYVAAQSTMATKDPSCNLRWSLVAALGRVESNHGRYQGTQLREDGTGTKPIRGIPLDGRPGVMTILDTDDGQYDGDPIYDRAVGPMQFIPSSWRFSAADGNGDGKTDPDNIFDAALAAGGYLCAGDTNLADPHQRSRAVFRYNRSEEYVQTVLSLADLYERGSVVAPHNEPVGTPPELPSPELPPASPPDPIVDVPPLETPPTTPPTTPTTSGSTTTSTTTTTTTTPCPPPSTVPDPTTTTSTTSTTTTTTVPGAPCPTTTTTTTTAPTTTTSTSTSAPPPTSTTSDPSTTTTGGG